MTVLPILPVSAVLPDVAEALAQKGAAVLVAPPGAGKTTLAPLHLLGDPRIGAGRILLLEPRRVAARAAARRMAEILGEEVGETVGWRMRLDTRVGPKTRVEVVTEGVFARMALADPELSGISAVLFDEFHERSLDADVGLALALDIRSGLREDLKLLVMSATLDGARVGCLLGAAPVIEAQGRAFPVAIRYRERPSSEPLEDAVAAAVRGALAEEEGSLLVFLPGQREIERVARLLEPRLPDHVLLAPLYGQLDASAQDRAVRPAAPGTRKIVLATSIAETSLTIDGVTVVIDSGYRRLPRFEPSTGLSRLETVRVSRAAADQRAGRAGRTAPGTAIRLWREEQTNALEPFDRPEILASDLSGFVLDCTAWGVSDPASLAFLDPPPTPALLEARALLRELGALDEDGRLTATGEAMRALPLPPRLARMVADAAPGERRLAAEIAVLLTERGLGGTEIDLGERLRRARADRGRGRDAFALARRIAQSAGARSGEGGPSGEGSVGALLALAYPDRIAIARGAPGAFVLTNGRGGTVELSSPLAREKYLVVADLSGEARSGRIREAAALPEGDMEAILAARGETADLVTFDPGAREVRARRVKRLGKAVLSEAPIAVPADGRAETALADGIRRLGMQAPPLGKEGERLLRRLRFLAKAYGEPWPDLSDDALLASLEAWLMPYLPGVTALSRIESSAIADALKGLVPAEARNRLDQLAPTHFEAPSGSTLPIRYEEDQPVLSVRVQELFGLRQHPAIADGRLPLTLELLSPAHRPIQITRDLPGFWRGSWADVRADLRGRYPRHVWPEDPAGAQATARAKPRGT